MPRGRGVDGIYKKNPPPGYIITETKYRTGAGSNTKYIDGDGTETTELLSTTKGSKINGQEYPSAKQMSDDWIHPRLTDEVNKRTADAIEEEGYERWLMIVDESGKVTQITKLNEEAKAIDTVVL